jgi:hypothetical protein
VSELKINDVSIYMLYIDTDQIEKAHQQVSLGMRLTMKCREPFWISAAYPYKSKEGQAIEKLIAEKSKNPSKNLLKFSTPVLEDLCVYASLTRYCLPQKWWIQNGQKLTFGFKLKDQSLDYNLEPLPKIDYQHQINLVMEA